ncbi:hypothetical protein H310_02922 [Aphanomyces invadans]|uniref:Uncharacterized protein n=1 Tax=Aphanomyces invadans TaxID=157072 RepID=A0A024UJY1_9STRA|nr:hypothetical protein H310_02922 [Aphanomyces invadans]ETW06761.1 hypothetical protein H310_02922 [Aphanomyces invadans]|eukprot:XP_008864836.1 hypothetical protein H310_02922 [Aphanomyces invadans]
MQYHTRYKARVCRRFWRVDIANEFRLETQQGSHTQLQACTTRVPRECDRATHQVDQWPRTHQEHGPCEREDAAAEVSYPYKTVNTQACHGPRRRTHLVSRGGGDDGNEADRAVFFES